MPWETVTEIQEHPPLMQETTTVGPLGGDARDSGAPTINARNIDNGPPVPCGGGAGPVSIRDPKGVLRPA
jgi:hypothetical protein